MPSALRARAKPFAALTFMDVLLPATSYRGEAVLSRTTVVSLPRPRWTSASTRRGDGHEGSAPADDPGPRPHAARERRPGARGGPGALGGTHGADDVGGARLARPDLVRPGGAHRDHHRDDGAL